jgi:N-acetylmuramoyl-L-alanine amidase
LRSEGRPRDGEAFVVEGAGPEPITGTTGSDGEIAFDVPITVGQCLLRLPARGAAYPVLVGHMDPHDEPSGIAARLEHLGFLAPDLRSMLAQGILGPDADRPTIPETTGDAVMEAIRAFQRHAGLTPTGVADADTAEAIRRAHDGD